MAAQRSPEQLCLICKHKECETYLTGQCSLPDKVERAEFERQCAQLRADLRTFRESLKEPPTKFL